MNLRYVSLLNYTYRYFTHLNTRKIHGKNVAVLPLLLSNKYFNLNMFFFENMSKCLLKFDKMVHWLIN